jgi:hypothetical protein
MQTIKINDSNYISFDNTEWNSRALGYLTNEIYDIQFDSIELANELFNQFETNCLNNNIVYTSLRINPDSKIKKEILERFGFINVETSILVNGSLKNVKENKILSKFKFTLRKCEDTDVNTVKQIASNDFNHGRFFEDHIIDAGVAKVRNSNWIDDLRKKSKVLVGEYDGVVFGFMALKANNLIVNLELGGVDSKYSHLAYSFWYKIFEYLKNESNLSVNALISTHNISVINLYSFFDFKFKESYIGYRKLRKTNFKL